MKEKNAEVRSAFKDLDEIMEHYDELYGDEARKFDYKRSKGSILETIDNLSWDDVAKLVEIFDSIFGSGVDVKLFYDATGIVEIVEDENGFEERKEVFRPLDVNKYDMITDAIKNNGKRSKYRIDTKVITEDKIEVYLKALLMYQMTHGEPVFYQKKDGTKIELDYLSKTEDIEERKREKAEIEENKRLEKECTELAAQVTKEVTEADWSEFYQLPMNAPDKIGKEIDFKSISDEELDRCEQLFDKVFEPIYKPMKVVGYDERRVTALRKLMEKTTIKNEGDEERRFINIEVRKLCEKQLGRYGDKDKKREYYELERYAKAYLVHHMLDPKKEIALGMIAKRVGKYSSGVTFWPGGETTLLKKDLPQADKEAEEEKKRREAEEEKKRQQEAEEKKRQEEAEKKRQQETEEKRRQEEEEEKKRQEAEEAEKKRKEEEEKKNQQEQNENKIEEAQPMEFEEGETAEPMEFEQGETADIIEGEEEEEELQPVDLATLNSLKDDIPALADKLIQGQRYALAHPEYDQNFITGFMKSFKGEKGALRKEIDRRSVLALAGRAKYIDKNYSSADIIKKHPELNGMQYLPRYMMMIQKKIANKVCNSDEYAATNALRNTYVKGVTLARDLNRVSDQLKLEEKNNTFTSTDWNYFVSGYIMTFQVGYNSDFNVEVEENGDFKLTFKEGITIDDFVGQRLDSSIDTYKSFKTSMDKISEKAKKFADQIEEMSKTGGEIGKFIADKFRDISKVNGDCQKGEIEDAIRNIYNNKDVVKDFIAEEKKKYKNLSGDKLKELKKQVGDGNYLYGTLTDSALEWANTLKLTGKSLAKLPVTNIRYDIQEISSDIVINKDYDIVVSRLDSYNKRQEEKQQEEEQLAEEQRQKEEEQQRRQEEEAENKRREEEKKREEEAAARQREKEEKRRQKELEEKQRREEEKRQKELEEQKRRAEEEKRRQQELEEQRRKEAELKEQRRKEAEEKKRKEEEEKKRQEEEEKKHESNIEKTRKKLRKIDNADTSAAWDIDFNLFENRDKDEFKDMTVSKMNADQVAACLKAYDELFGKESDIKSFCREEKSTWGDGSPLFEYILNDHGYRKDHGWQGDELLGKEVSEENISDITKCMVILYLTQKQKTLYYYTEGGKYFELAPLQKSKKWREDEKKHDEEKEKIINDSKQSAAEAAKKVDEIDRSEILDLPINSEKNRDKAFDIKSISEKELKLCSDTFDKIFEPVYAHTREVNKYVGKKEDNYEELFHGITDESFIKEGEGGGFMDRQVLYNMHILCKKDLPGYKNLKSSEQDKIQQKYAKAYILKRMAQKNGGLKLGIPHKAFVINSDVHSEGKHDCILTPVTADHIKKYEEYKKKKAEEYAKRAQKEERDRQERIKALFTDGIKSMDAGAAFDLPENKTNRIDLADFSTISDAELEQSTKVFEQLLGKDIKISCFYFTDENGKEVKFFDQIKEITKPYYTRGGENRYTKPADYANYTQAYGRAVLMHLMTHGKATGIYYRENKGETYELSAFTVPKGVKTESEDTFSIDKLCSVAASAQKAKDAKKAADTKKDQKTTVNTDKKTDDNTINDPIPTDKTVIKQDDRIININKEEDLVIKTSMEEPLDLDPVKDIGVEKATAYVNAQSDLLDLRRYVGLELSSMKSNIGIGRKDVNKELEEDGGPEYRTMMAKLNTATALFDNYSEHSLNATSLEVLNALKQLQSAAIAYQNSHEPGLLKRLFFKKQKGFKHSYGLIRYQEAKKLVSMASEMYQAYYDMVQKTDPEFNKTVKYGKDYAKKCKDAYKLQDPEGFDAEKYMTIKACENKMRQMIYATDPNVVPALKYYHKDKNYGILFKTGKMKNGMKKGMEAACFIAMKALDRFADPNLSEEEAQQIVDSFKPEEFKAYVKGLKKTNPRFTECLANHGEKAFEEFDKDFDGVLVHQNEVDLDLEDAGQDQKNRISDADDEKVTKVWGTLSYQLQEMYTPGIRTSMVLQVQEGDLTETINQAYEYMTLDVLVNRKNQAKDILLEMEESGNQKEIMEEFRQALTNAVAANQIKISEDDKDNADDFVDEFLENNILKNDLLVQFRKIHKKKTEKKKHAFDKKKRSKDIDLIVDEVKERKENLSANAKKKTKAAPKNNGQKDSENQYAPELIKRQTEDEKEEKNLQISFNGIKMNEKKKITE